MTTTLVELNPANVARNVPVLFLTLATLALAACARGRRGNRLLHDAGRPRGPACGAGAADQYWLLVQESRRRPFRYERDDD